MTQPLPPDLIEYEHQLTAAIRRRIDARRRGVATVAMSGTAAVMAVGVGLVGLASSGGGLGTPPADAAILRHAVRALEQPPGTILHLEVTDARQSSTGTTVTDTREVWILPVPAGTPCNVRQDCPAAYLRTSYQAAGSSERIESSTGPDDLTDLYDSATGTVYRPPGLAASWQAPEPLDSQNFSGLNPFSADFASQLQRAVNDGRAHVVGETTLSGQTVVQIAGETDICMPPNEALPPGLPSRPSRDGQDCAELASWSYDVTPGSYQPVALTSATPGEAAETITFEAWQTLPAAQNMDLFSLTDQYPSARVDGRAGEYQTEASRFDTVEGVSANMTSTFLPAGSQAATSVR